MDKEAPMKHRVSALFLSVVLCLSLAGQALAAAPAEERHTLDLSSRIHRAGGFDAGGSGEGTVELFSMSAEKERELYDYIYEALSLGWNLDGSQDQEGVPCAYLDLSEYRIRGDDASRKDPDSDYNKLWEIYCRVCNDHSELFYVSGGVQYAIVNDYVSIVRAYYYPGFREEDVARFNSAVDEIVAALGLEDPSLPKLDKLLAIHDYLVEHVVYNVEVKNGGEAPTQNVQSAWGAIMDGDAVCQGYADAFQLLATRAGIQSRYIDATTIQHAWNMVELDGTWYNVDVTWDDTDWLGMGSYQYFLRSTDWMQLAEEEGGGGHTAPWNVSLDEMQPCDDDSFANGYAFNDTAHPVCPAGDGEYYYLPANSSYAPGDVCKGPLKLDGSAAIVAFAVRPIFYSGVCWRNGALYYLQADAVDQSQNKETATLRRLDLATREDLFMGPVPQCRDWTKVEGTNGYTISSPMELQYDEQRKSLWVYTEDVGWVCGAAVFDGAWSDQRAQLVEKNRAYVDDQTGGGDADVAGVYLPAGGPDTVTLVSAWYQADGRFLSMKKTEFNGLSAGCHFLELPDGRKPGGSGDLRRKLFLLDSDGLRPLDRCLDCGVEASEAGG